MVVGLVKTQLFSSAVKQDHSSVRESLWPKQLENRDGTVQLDIQRSLKVKRESVIILSWMTDLGSSLSSGLCLTV